MESCNIMPDFKLIIDYYNTKFDIFIFWLDSDK